MNKKFLALVVRYSDNPSFSKGLDTIEEHNKIYKNEGYFFLGKLGRSIGEINIKKFSDDSFVRNIILVKKNRSKSYEFYIARLEGIYKELPSLKLVPEYYRDNKYISAWFKIVSPLKKMNDDEVAEWIIKSSGFPLRETMSRSMAGFFISTKGSPISPTQIQPKKKNKIKNSSKGLSLDDDGLIEDLSEIDYLF